MYQLCDPGQSLLIPETHFPNLQNGANETTLLFLKGAGSLPALPTSTACPHFQASDSGLASDSGGSEWPLALHSCLEDRLGPPWTALKPGLSVAMFPLQERRPLSVESGHRPK